MAIDWKAPEIMRRARVGAMRGVVIGIGIVENRAVVLVTQGKKTGRIYRRRGVSHQSSAPGEPFASDTGTTIGRREVTLDTKNLRATLHFRSKNAVRLELGTRKMKARPFARRALAETRREVEDVIFVEIIEELRRK